MSENQNEKMGKLVTCFPIIPGNGSKHVVANLAHNYKLKYPDLQVAIADFDFHYPTLLANESSFDTIHGVDHLLDQIDGKQLTENLFKENMVKLKNGVHLLKGTQLKRKYVIIQRHHIEEILHYLRKLYDVVFIAVANQDDNAGTVYTLCETDELLLVATNNYTNLYGADDAVGLARRYYKKSLRLKLVFNRYNDKSQTDFGSWFREQNVEMITAIPFQEKAIDGHDLFGLIGTKLSFKKGPKLNPPYEAILNHLQLDDSFKEEEIK